MLAKHMETGQDFNERCGRASAGRTESRPRGEKAVGQGVSAEQRVWTPPQSLVTGSWPRFPKKDPARQTSRPDVLWGGLGTAEEGDWVEACACMNGFVPRCVPGAKVALIEVTD